MAFAPMMALHFAATPLLSCDDFSRRGDLASKVSIRRRDSYLSSFRRFAAFASFALPEISRRRFFVSLRCALCRPCYEIL